MRSGELLVSELDLLANRAEVAIVWPWKYLGTSDGRDRLYDLDADPLETRDVSAGHPELVAELKAALADRRVLAGSGLGLSCVAGLREQTVRLELEARGGAMGIVEALGLEAQDRVHVEGERVTVELHLRPADSARGLTPSVLARATPDRDGLRAAAFQGPAVRVRVDSSQAGSRVRLRRVGGGGLAIESGEIGIDRLRVDSVPRDLAGGREPTCYLYYVEEARASQELPAMDPELEERLRELGYLE